MQSRRLAVAALLACAWATAAGAAHRTPILNAGAPMYPEGVRYDASFPTPEAFLGHELGRAPVRHHELVEYITRVAEASDRMTLEVIGHSHERRPILFVVVTSPENHARLAAIRERHVALSEPGSGQAVEADMPVVTWLNYGVHGAEASGMDAALPTIYHLAAAQGPEIERILAGSVILVTAVFNPDGHAKRIAWLDAYGSRITNPDPQHIEHDLDWRFARTNHYGFDLNRQWLPVTQPEPRAWMRKWHAWRPNLTVDYHEMGADSTYYFHPGVPTRTNPLVTAEGRRLMEAVVRTSEAFLDGEGRLYFHDESFDNYYIGKGSTFPYVNGGVGILYEAASTVGVELDTAHGLRTYRENVRKHFRTALASLEGALGLRRELLEYQKDFYASALEEARDAAVQAWVFAAPGDPVRLHQFLDLLDHHRIEAFRLAREITQDGVTFRPGEAAIVPVAQPQYRLIRGIFETVHEFEDTTFYDISTWTMPLAFNLEHAPLSGRRFNRDLVGARLDPEPPAVEAPDVAPYAYAFTWAPYFAPRALYRVLDEELLAKVATKPFTAATTRGPVALPRGTIVVPFDRQRSSKERIHALMRKIAAEDAVFVHAVTSGASADGGASVDLGGPSFRPLAKPKVLVVTGRDIDRYAAGEMWHLLDFRLHMPVTLRDRERLADIDWKPYTHVVFPGGDYGTAEEPWDPEWLPRLRTWVDEGGTVIGQGRGAHWVRAQVLDYVQPGKDGQAPAEMAEEPLESPSGHSPYLLPGDVEPYRFPYAEKERRDAVELIGGAIFAGDLDVTHPLGFGYAKREIALHKDLRDVLERPRNPYATVIQYATPPVLSGYASEANRIMLEGTAALIAERKKKGSVILFADNPNFRGYWYGTNKLFANAIFFSRVFDPLPAP
ncbi:MAG TPA: M14 family zinc carboxypeptidase [Woeseiaceae bacterium]|nr:M14 family zinc carboxypeptidase [Woeseiaceae bacterium]